MNKPLIGLGFIVIISVIAFFFIINTTRNRINPHPDCNQWHLAKATHTPVNSPQEALDVYQPYVASLPLYQDSSIPTNLTKFEKQFNHAIEPITQSVHGTDGHQITVEGFDMVLAHIVDRGGNIYKYVMCRHGQPIN